MAHIHNGVLFRSKKMERMNFARKWMQLQKHTEWPKPSMTDAACSLTSEVTREKARCESRSLIAAETRKVERDHVWGKTICREGNNKKNGEESFVVLLKMSSVKEKKRKKKTRSHSSKLIDEILDSPPSELEIS